MLLYSLATSTIYFWLVIAGLAIYVLSIISACIVVMSESRSPIRSLAWVIALIFLPLVGLVFYLFFGRSLQGMRLLSRHHKRKISRIQHRDTVNLEDTPLSEPQRHLVKLAASLSHYPLTLNNELDIFTDGTTKFQSLIADLENASESILVQYYIIEDDIIGNRIADILIRKAREGLLVRVLYDHVGSFSSPAGFFRRMQKEGVDVRPFFRVTFPQLANRINWRNHRKIIVIDRKTGYIGGMNIADRYTATETQNLRNAWRDTHFRVTGQIIQSLLISFTLDWNFIAKSNFMEPMEAVNIAPPSALLPMQLVTGGPAEQWDNLSLAFLKAIAGARKSIYIQTPYFLPTDALLNALIAASLSKIDVRIMLPRKSDSRLIQYASLSYVEQCLKAGIKVYLYDPGMLHAKTMIIDDDFLTSGSTNFDFRSLENNFESNLLIYSTQANRAMRDIFFADRRHCTKLTLAAWRRRPRLQRLLESLVRLFAPIL